MIGGCRSCAWWLLKLSYSALFIVLGADKFFNLLTQWQKYIGPMIHANVPVEAATLVLAFGVFEVIAGALMLFVDTRLGALCGAIWMVLMSVNLITMGYPYDVAVYHIVFALSLLGLVVLAPDAACASCSCKPEKSKKK